MIEDATLKYLGIYPEAVERADAIVEGWCEVYGIDSDEEVWPNVLDAFRTRFGVEEYGARSLTSWLVRAAFEALDSALGEHGVDGSRTDYYVNGMASSFCIDGEGA